MGRIEHERPERKRGRLVLPDGIGNLQDAHRRYLRQRGFDPEEIETLWKIQATGIATRLAWRLFIPIILRGETVSWTTRAVSDRAKSPRYVSAGAEEEALPARGIGQQERNPRIAKEVPDVTTPTLSMRMFGEQQRRLGLTRRRHEAAKKAWRTRRRLATPTPKMRTWLEWLSRQPHHVIVQQWDSYLGSSFSFGAYPNTMTCSQAPQRFTRSTFFAIQKRGWIEVFHQTEEVVVCTSYQGDHYGHTRYWRITDKGRKALGGV